MVCGKVRSVRVLLTAFAASAAASTSQGQIVDTRIPLNYNFHGMAHSAAITGEFDEWTAVAANASNRNMPAGWTSSTPPVTTASS